MTVPEVEPRLLLSQIAAAHALSISRRAISCLLADGRLNSVHIGGRVLVRRSEVEQMAVSGVPGRIRPA